jgi:hypothetical protein
MGKRRPLDLFLCLAEASRAALAYAAFIPFLAPKEISTSRFILAALFAPQLLVPLAWFTLWIESKPNAALARMAAAAKILILTAESAWIAAFFMGLRARLGSDGLKAMAEGSVQGLFIIADIALLAVTFFRLKSAEIEESRAASANAESGLGAPAPAIGEEPASSEGTGA